MILLGSWMLETWTASYDDAFVKMGRYSLFGPCLNFITVALLLPKNRKVRPVLLRLYLLIDISVIKGPVQCGLEILI